MNKLKDIVKKSKNGQLQCSSPQSSFSVSLMNSIASVPFTISGVAQDKKEEFSQQAAALVTSDKFLDELQDKIGLPKENESEDEFVNNAKNKMRELLKSKLK